MAKIVIVDDDRKLVDLLKTYLAENNHTASFYTNPRDFLKQDMGRFDLVILDILMPEMDGFDVLREVRKKSDISVIMLTARGDIYDRIVGLELGADDYLPKPFEPRELLARIEAVLRRSGPVKRMLDRLEYTSFTFIPESMKLEVDGIELILTGAENELLLLFCNNPFKVLSRDKIMEGTKNITWESFDRSVDVLVSRLRRKLADNPNNPGIIRTVWGEGYMFIARRKDEK